MMKIDENEGIKTIIGLNALFQNEVEPDIGIKGSSDVLKCAYERNEEKYIYEKLMFALLFAFRR